jgi:hypothetical protein
MKDLNNEAEDLPFRGVESMTPMLRQKHPNSRLTGFQVGGNCTTKITGSNMEKASDSILKPQAG